MCDCRNFRVRRPQYLAMSEAADMNRTRPFHFGIGFPPSLKDLEEMFRNFPNNKYHQKIVIGLIIFYYALKMSNELMHLAIPLYRYQPHPRGIFKYLGFGILCPPCSPKY